MDELNKVETVARFRGTEMEVVRYLADVMVSPGRGVQALNDDLDFAFLLLRQMEQGFDHDHEASPLGTAYKQPGNLSQSDACVAQQRYSDLARWFMALAQKAEEIAHAICVINARGAQDPLFQTQRPPSTTQDTYPLRSTSAHHETRASGALSQENPNRLRAGAPSYIPLSSQVLISNHNLSCSRSLERADTASHGKMEQDGGAVGQQSQPSPALSLSPTSRSKGRTSSSLERLASAKIAAIEQAVDGSATGRPPSPDAATSAFVPATGSRQKARTSSSLERLATAKIAAVERSSNAVHYPNDTQAPIINALQVPQMTPTPTLSNYSQPSSTGVIQSSLSNSPGSSPRGRTRGFAGRTMANVIYQDTTISQSEMPTCYLRWTNFNHGKPSFLPFSTVRNATVRIAHGIHNVCITSLLDTRDSNGDIFLKFNKLSEAENYAEG
ncbi:hypothetical protein BDQ17DRAFT_451210 [Cyathus striatus]|nr:hypothetical protein BDQ17DRAFT_451210 [Cyathus striatus]